MLKYSCHRISDYQIAENSTICESDAIFTLRIDTN